MRTGTSTATYTVRNSEKQALLSSEACESRGNYEGLASGHGGSSPIHVAAAAAPVNQEEGANPFIHQAHPLSPLLHEEEDKQEEGQLDGSAWKHQQHHHHTYYGQHLKLLLGFALGIFATLGWNLLTPHFHDLLITGTSVSIWPNSDPKDVGTASAGIAEPSVKSFGRTVQLDGIHYYLPGRPRTSFSLKKVPSTWSEAALFPLTVVSSDAQTFGDAHIDAVSAAYAARDDVWSPGFMQNVLLHYNGSASSAALDISTSASGTSFLLNGYTARQSTRGFRVSAADTVPAGPYFAAVTGKQVSLFEAWRLYSDTERAFLTGIVPHDEDEGALQMLPAVLPEGKAEFAIAVPSRLYYTKTAEKPLAGVRVSIKDLYDIEGLRTSMSSRAWLSLYPAAKQTAPAIQRLLDLGAIIVGKTRFSQFANGEYGTADSVDFSVPFSIRGEGYQDPSSSSSGAGAAAGAYSWIDLHLGSDTGGSVRAPAGVNGAFGNRPSQGAMDLSGALPLSPSMDTAALLGLDARAFAEHCKLYYGGNSTFRSAASFPKKLNYLVDPAASANQPTPGFFPVQNPDAAPVYEHFVQLLEGLLETKRVEVDFYAEFYRQFGVYPPEYVGRVYSSLTAYEQWHLIGHKFDSDYAAANNGDRPFIDPPVRANWDRAVLISESDYQEFLHRKQDFAGFVRHNLMDSTSASSCSNALTVFPTMTGRPSYKSDYHLETPAYTGFNRFGIAQLGQVPEIVIPIGEVPYFSKITQTTKYLPISISIQAAHGCDFVLYDLLIALADAGIVRNPTGGTQRAFA